MKLWQKFALKTVHWPHSLLYSDVYFYGVFTSPAMAVQVKLLMSLITQRIGLPVLQCDSVDSKTFIFPGNWQELNKTRE